MGISIFCLLKLPSIQSNRFSFLIVWLLHVWSVCEIHWLNECLCCYLKKNKFFKMSWKMFPAHLNEWDQSIISMNEWFPRIWWFLCVVGFSACKQDNKYALGSKMESLRKQTENEKKVCICKSVQCTLIWSVCVWESVSVSVCGTVNEFD